MPLYAQAKEIFQIYSKKWSVVMSIPTSSYDKIFQNYSDALQWMKGIGVTLGPGRTQHYYKIVKYCKENYKVATEDDVKKILPDFVSSMFEIHDFIDIYKAFRNVPITKLDHIVAKLQKGVNGPINASQETHKSTTARNFLFEAVFAAKAHRPVKGVEAILDAESDTGIKIGDKKLWVECKRVTTTEKIEANVKKASSQLESIIKKQTGSGHRGIVALEVTKILSPSDTIFVCNNDSQLLASVDRMMDKFILENSEIWQRLYTRRSKKIIGTIIRFAFMCSSENRNLPVHASQWGLNPRLGVSNENEAVLKKLVASVQSVP